MSSGAVLDGESPSSAYRRLATNAAAALTGRVAAIGLAIVLSTVLFRVLGAVRYGIWSFCYMLVGYLALFDLGLGGAVERLVARAWVERDAAEVERVVNHGIACALAIGAVLQGLVFLLPVSDFNGIDIRPVVYVMPSCLLLSLLAALTAGGLSGVQLLGRLNVLRISMNALGTGFVLLLTILGVTRLDALLLAYASGLAGASIGAWVILRRHVGRLRLKPLRFDRRLAAEFTRFGGLLQLAVFGPQLADQAFRAVLGLRFGASWMGCYDLGARAALVIRSLTGGLLVAMVPFGIQQRIAGGARAIERLHRLTVKYTALLLLPASGVLLLRSQWIISLWLGNGPGTSDVLLIFRLFLVVHAVAGLATPIAMLGRSAGIPGVEATVLAIASAVGLVGALVVPNVAWALAAFGVASALGASALWWWLATHGVGSLRTVREIAAASGIALAAMMLSALLDWLFPAAWMTAAWPSLAIRVIVTVGVPLALAAPLAWASGVLSPSEREFWKTVNRPGASA